MECIERDSSSHGPKQHKNSGRTVLYMRYERFGEIWRHVFLEAARFYPTTTKNFHKIFFKTLCHLEMNCPAGVTVFVEEEKVTILVQTLDCCQNSQHKGSGECEARMR
jgi:hypothetical protein